MSVWRQAARSLLTYFDPDQPLAGITKAHAADFSRWLRTPAARSKGAATGLAEATARKRPSVARQFLADAVMRELIGRNPFSGIPCASVANRSRDHFVTRDDLARVLDACPDTEWRAIALLSRIGGLRCPSEHLMLRWSDVDWDRGRLRVTSP